MPRPPNAADAWKDIRERYSQAIARCDLWMKRAYLLAAILRENGIDADWVLRADKETVTKGLIERTKK